MTSSFRQGPTTAAGLVLASLRSRPRRDTATSIAGGVIGARLHPDAVRSGLRELRRRGLAREGAGGHWRLTPAGRSTGRSGSTTPAAAADDVSVTADHHGTVATVSVAGPLRAAGAAALRDALSAAERATPEIVALELSAVTALDEDGVAAIADADGRGRRSGSRLVIVSPSSASRAVLHASAVADRLTFAGTSFVRGESAA